MNVKKRSKKVHSLIVPNIRTMFLLVIIFFFCLTSCQKASEQKKIVAISNEYAINKAQDFCNNFNYKCNCFLLPEKFEGKISLDIENRKYNSFGYADYNYKQLHLFLWGDTYFREAKAVVCEERDAFEKGIKNAYVYFLIRQESKEIERYSNLPVYEIYTQKYGQSKKKVHINWPEFITAEKAKDIFYAIADKLKIPSDMVFERVEKNDEYGVWSAVWVRKRNGYKYEGDAVSMSIMGATGEFISYTKTYRGVPCSTDLKISKEQALAIGWEKFKKYRTWKMRSLGEKGKDLYEVKAEPLIIQTSAFGRGGKPVVNIEGSKLAWIIKYDFTGGFEEPKELLNKFSLTKDERRTVDIFYSAMDKKWRELGAPERKFDIRIDAATGKVLYASPARPWFVRWFGELTVKK
jgi:hypothetical protein